MSDLFRRGRPAIIGLCLALSCATSLPGQASATRELQAAGALVRRLRRERDSLEAGLRARDALRDQALGWRSVQVGRLTVDLLPEEGTALEPAVRQAWVLVRERYGRLAELAPLMHLRLQRDTGTGPAAPPSVSIYRMDRPRPGTPYTGRRVVGSADLDSLAFGVAAAAVEALGALQDSLLTPWPPLSLPLSEPPKLRQRVYVHLVTSPYRLARSCQVADLLACARAFGIIQPVDYLAWFVPEERRRLVGSDSWGQWNRACVTAEFLPACDTVLVHEPERALLPLGDADSRASLLLTMIELGGRDALARVREARTAPLPDRLAVGAGVSTDSLLRRWHASIVAARPLPVTVRYRDAATALCWFMVLMALALGSTRWR